MQQTYLFCDVGTTELAAIGYENDTQAQNKFALYQFTFEINTYIRDWIN